MREQELREEFERTVREKFERRVQEIQHYHSRFRDFPPGDDRGAATYGIVMRTQIQDLLQILEVAREYGVDLKSVDL